MCSVITSFAKCISGTSFWGQRTRIVFLSVQVTNHIQGAQCASISVLSCSQCTWILIRRLGLEWMYNMEIYTLSQCKTSLYINIWICLSYFSFQGGRSAAYKSSVLQKNPRNGYHQKEGVALFRVQGLKHDCVQAIQVDLVSLIKIRSIRTISFIAEWNIHYSDAALNLIFSCAWIT